MRATAVPATVAARDTGALPREPRRFSMRRKASAFTVETVQVTSRKD